jgi:hypothetical protein
LNLDAPIKTRAVIESRAKLKARVEDMNKDSSFREFVYGS